MELSSQRSGTGYSGIFAEVCKVLSVLFFIVLVASLVPAWGAARTEGVEMEVANAEETPVDTPRSAVRRILELIAKQNALGLQQMIDTRPTPELRRINLPPLIEQLPTLLNAYGVMMPVGLVSNEITGTQEADLPLSFEKIGEIVIDGTAIPFLLQRVETYNGESRWLVSQSTLVALSGVSDRVLAPRIDKILPQFMTEKFWLGAPVGHWLTLPLIAAIGVVLGLLMRRLLKSLGSRYQQANTTSKRGSALLACSTPFGIVLAVLVFWSLERFLGISIVIRQHAGIVNVSLFWIALFVFAWSLLDRFSQHGESVLRTKNQVSGLSLIIFFRASAKVILIILAAILVLDSNGIDVTAGLAALGIGGIALALGAQKTIENMVGSVTLVVDQPIRVGDFCRIGEVMGSVEHIGLRSTRIRTRSDTLVNYPNGALSTEKIENFTLRRRFLLHSVLNLRYETGSKKLDRLLSALRTMLAETDHVSRDGFWVRFVGYGESSLDVEVFAYIHASNYDEFLERQETVLLSIGRIVEANGSGFAFPSRTVYLAHDKISDSEGKA